MTLLALPKMSPTALAAYGYFDCATVVLSRQEGAGFLEKKKIKKGKHVHMAVLTEGRRCLWPLAVLPCV